MFLLRYTCKTSRTDFAPPCSGLSYRGFGGGVITSTEPHDVNWSRVIDGKAWNCHHGVKCGHYHTAPGNSTSFSLSFHRQRGSVELMPGALQCSHDIPCRRSVICHCFTTLLLSCSVLTVTGRIPLKSSNEAEWSPKPSLPHDHAAPLLKSMLERLMHRGEHVESHVCGEKQNYICNDVELFFEFAIGVDHTRQIILVTREVDNFPRDTGKTTCNRHLDGNCSLNFI